MKEHKWRRNDNKEGNKTQIKLNKLQIEQNKVYKKVKTSHKEMRWK